MLGYLGLATNARKPSPTGIREGMGLGRTLSEEQAAAEPQCHEKTLLLSIAHLCSCLAQASFFPTAAKFPCWHPGPQTCNKAREAFTLAALGHMCSPWANHCGQGGGTCSDWPGTENTLVLTVPSQQEAFMGICRLNA